MFEKNFVDVIKYDLMSKLPDPFLFNDGRRVESSEDWEERRKMILECNKIILMEE